MFNGIPTREWFSRGDPSSPTASLEAIFLTATIDSYEVQYIMVLDVPNAFIQNKLTPKKDGEERVIIQITGVLVDMLLGLDRNTYSKHVVLLNGNKVIYVVVLTSIYGILVAGLLFYKNFRGHLENIGF